MRKITQLAVDAFMRGENFKSGNTQVIASAAKTELYLHDNLIAMKTVMVGVSITNAGYFTNTTKERLNGLPGVKIQQKAGQWFLNGVKWGGGWITVRQ